MAKKERIGKFEVIAVIGRGTSGTVYAGRGADGTVALKCFDRTRVKPQWQEQFKARVRALARLEDPALVRVVGAGSHQGSPYVAMEFLEAARLDERLSVAGPLPITDALVIAESMARVLGVAADAGIAHYDIRSAKIALDAEAAPRIFDLGMMKPENSGLATASYASPEQFRGGKLDARSQIYSLGIVLHELLDGQLPFQAASLSELKGLHLRATPPLLISGASNLPANVLRLLELMLAKDPNDRCADFGALTQRIEAVLRALESEPTMFSTPIPGAITNSFMLDEAAEPAEAADATYLTGRQAAARTRAAIVFSDQEKLLTMDEDERAQLDRDEEDVDGDFPSLKRRRESTAAMPVVNAAARHGLFMAPEFVAMTLIASAVGMLGSAAWWALGVG